MTSMEAESPDYIPDGIQGMKKVCMITVYLSQLLLQCFGVYIGNIIDSQYFSKYKSILSLFFYRFNLQVASPGISVEKHRAA
jgi:hypothetical protein